MIEFSFSELVNINSLEKMAENLYEISGVPVGIIDVNGTIYVKTGWQDICTKFHRVNECTCRCCLISDKYIEDHLMDGMYVEYKCINNLWDIGVPIIIAGEHLATIFLGQFFYEDEVIDLEFFRKQAFKYGFDEEEYIDALKRVPIFSKKKVKHIIEYYIGLVSTLGESGLRQLEYKNAQNTIVEAQKYMDTVFNSINDAVFIHDFLGQIININETAALMFGYSYMELINMNVSEIVSDKSPIDRLQLTELFMETKVKNPIIRECICKTKDNTEFWVEINIRTVILNGKDAIVATVRDITVRKLEEVALKKEAKEMETLRTEFFGNVSHELKTPLNIILGSIKIIVMAVQDEGKPIDRNKILNNLNIERQNCFRLLKLINNLIDSTKLDSGFIELNLLNCNIISVVEEITLSVGEYINNNNLKLTFDTEIEEKIMACDLDKIERIMLNLLSNAVKFTPAGGEIYVNILDGKEYITIVVEDTGIGIPDNKLDIIFDRFRQVDKSFTRNHEGSGIGLSLVKSLTEMHGGEITVESEFGFGTKFIVKLPIKVLESGTVEENNKQVNCAIENCEQSIKIEFSDINK